MHGFTPISIVFFIIQQLAFLKNTNTRKKTATIIAIAAAIVDPIMILSFNVISQLWVFVAEQAVGRLVFFDGWKTANRLMEAVVGIVVVTLAHLAQQHRPRAFLY